VGIGLSRKVQNYPEVWWLAAAPLLLLLKSKNLTSLLLVLIFGLTVGLWRGSQYMVHVHQLQSLALHQVTIEATATSDSIYGNRSQVQFTGNQIQLIEPYQSQLTGSFKLSGFGVHMVYRGDRIRVSGKVYPSRGANQATIAYAKLQTVGSNNSLIYKISRNFSAGMQNALPEPLASFAMGLLIGQRVTMPPEIILALTMVGLIHIVAVSGYNVTIMARAVARLRLPSKYQQLVISLVLISGFVLITGFSASIVRAAIVSLLTLWAWYYGRKIAPLVLITFTAAMTGLFSPFYVWSDLGWYLSFLAFFGVLVIGPIITARLFSKPPKLLTSVLIETLSAELMTLPLIMMTFGQLSLIAIVANILIVPLVPLAMLLSAVAGLAGMLVPSLAGWLALPARLVLTYMLDLVHILSNIPSEFLHLSISPAIMIMGYGLVLLMVLAATRHLKLRAKVIKAEA